MSATTKPAEGGTEPEPKPRPQRPKKDASKTEEALAALGQGLSEVLGGFEQVDRDVRFDGVARADLIGSDSSGRLVWVIVADENEDATALAVLDGISFVRRNPELLRRHFGFIPRASVGPKPARLVLVLPTPLPALVERLRPFAGREFEMFSVRAITSAAGERSYLTPVGASSTAADFAPARSRDSFMDHLSDSQRSLARTLVQRMQRMDDELSLDTSAAGLVWSFAGDTLAQLERRDTGLVGGVAPEFALLRIATELDVERFLDTAVGRLVRLFSNDTDPLDDEEPPGSHLGNGPILTPEEIAAFQD